MKDEISNRVHIELEEHANHLTCWSRREPGRNEDEEDLSQFAVERLTAGVVLC